MFSKPIFKQTLRSNYKLWIIFTVIMCALSAVIIAVFDQKLISSMMDMIKDTPIAEMGSIQISNMTSILGILSSSFYEMQGIILPLIFIIMTANSLIASQVDRGSMAYLLSAPIKRSKVVRTQALYLILSIFLMFLALTAVGLASVQIFHGGVFGESYTADVKAAANILKLDDEEVANDLNLILKNSEALKEGAKARVIDEDVYTAYLNLKIADNAYKAASEVLDIDADDVRADLELIKNDDKALDAAAKVSGMDKATYSAYIDMAINQKAAASEQSSDMQSKLMDGFAAAADVLDMGVTDVASDMKKLKSNGNAIDAAVEASGIPKEMFTTIIIQQLANDEMILDEGIVFNMKDYVMLNLGTFLLMFAISGISFLFSCIFNLTKNSLSLGAGIPVAFFIFAIMSRVDSSLEGFKYLSLNTLFDTTEITTGGSYSIQFIALATIGAILFALGMRWFKEKDLPL